MVPPAFDPAILLLPHRPISAERQETRQDTCLSVFNVTRAASAAAFSSLVLARQSRATASALHAAHPSSVHHIARQKVGVIIIFPLYYLINNVLCICTR